MAPSDQFAKSAWMLASIAVVVGALYLAKGVLVPLTLAVLLSFMLSPVCDWLERHGLGRIPAVLGRPSWPSPRWASWPGSPWLKYPTWPPNCLITRTTSRRNYIR